VKGLSSLHFDIALCEGKAKIGESRGWEKKSQTQDYVVKEELTKRLYHSTQSTGPQRGMARSPQKRLKSRGGNAPPNTSTKDEVEGCRPKSKKPDRCRKGPVAREKKGKRTRPQNARHEVKDGSGCAGLIVESEQTTENGRKGATNAQRPVVVLWKWMGERPRWKTSYTFLWSRVNGREKSIPNFKTERISSESELERKGKRKGYREDDAEAAVSFSPATGMWGLRAAPTLEGLKKKGFRKLIDANPPRGERRH